MEDAPSPGLAGDGFLQGGQAFGGSTDPHGSGHAVACSGGKPRTSGSPRRDEDDGVSPRIDAGREQFGSSSSVRRKGHAERLVHLGQEPPGLNRRTEDEEDASHVTIALLQRQPAGQRLTVTWRGLGLDAIPPHRPLDHAIPGPTIARDG